MQFYPVRLAVVATSAAVAVFGATPAFAADAAPLPPTSVTATYVTADAEVDIAWVDASTDETSFVIERCQGVGCTSFTALTTWPAIAGTGSHPWYADCTGLLPGYTYRYRVGTVNRRRNVVQRRCLGHDSEHRRADGADVGDGGLCRR